MPDTKVEMTASARAAGDAFAEAVAILERLRAPCGCAWDREQTMESIRPHTLEEMYEVFDAIDRRAWPELQDELGDLLLQVIFYAQIAKDDGQFDMEAVAKGLSAKLLRRHPHVFGDAVATTAADVNATWERVKATEKVADAKAGLLDGVPRFVPALTEATKLGRKAAKVGFDWTEMSGLLDKVVEEVEEVREELTDGAIDAAKVEEEVGDLLFVMVSLARHSNVDPESALRKANGKFRRRFAAMELAAGGSVDGQSAAAMEELWAQAKREERA